MKNHLIILLVLVTSYRVNFAQGIDSPYIFPITATNPKWKTFKSRSEMAEVLQIPPQQLKGMSTRALVSTCMNFPMFKDLYFFNHVQIGFNNLKPLLMALENY